MGLLIKKGIYSCVKWLMLLISLTAGLSAAASENMPDNFYRVTPELYRSAHHQCFLWVLYNTDNTNEIGALIYFNGKPFHQ